MADVQRPGRMRIVTRAFSGDLVQMVVEDNGPGVPPDLVGKIFEPFFTTKEVGTGTGLGLSIAHSIMTEHKGRIFYQTSSLGGAGFVLEFPAASSPHRRGTARKARPRSSLPRPPRHGPPRNREKSWCSTMKNPSPKCSAKCWACWATRPTLCHAAADALELLDRQEFDLIISDFRMPGINGRQFYELVAQKNRRWRAGIIFLTGDVVNEETLAFLKSIGNPHIAKPFNLTNVKAIVAGGDAFQPDTAAKWPPPIKRTA